MAAFTTLLLWLVACLTLISAVPLERSVDNTTSIAETNGGDYPYSLQILLARHPGNYYSWDIWEGPQGVSVNPCGDSRFKSISKSKEFINKPESYWNNPGFPRASNVPVTIGNYGLKSCNYISEGTSTSNDGTSPGRMECESGGRVTYSVDCEWDPQYWAPKIVCEKELSYRHAYMCEF